MYNFSNGNDDMNRTRVLITAIALFACTTLHAQMNPVLRQETKHDTLRGEWSLSLNSGYDYTASASMHGSMADFVSDFSKDYNNSKYPFGDNSTVASSFGGDVAYRFRGSNISAFFEMQYHQFYANDQQTPETKAYMAVLCNIFGAGYTLGNRYDLFNAFANAGIAFNDIHGSIDYLINTNSGMNTAIPATLRLGFVGEVGAGYNLPETMVGFHVSVGYTDANFIGKDYTAPNAMPPAPLPSRSLNDGANPNNPDDQSRTIAFISLRFGLTIWM